ncbi:PTS sugar transporter subunit IIA, partial [bacterium]|nr:PTS sugar transporter subunit IIA [bacterium]
MTLLDILNEKVIKVELEAKDKEGALKELVGILDESDLIQDKEKTLEAVKKREELMSTGIGHGVAIPHAKVEGVDKVIAALGKSKEGIDFKALDGEPVYIFFLLI